jgi:hypothetical protein
MVLFLQSPIISPGSSAHGKPQGLRVCLLASQVTSQLSFTPRALDFTLESLASQVLAVNNTNQPTTSHFFLNPISSIPQLLASHHFAERTRQERSTSPPRHCTTTPTRHMPHGKQVGRQADSFSHFHPSFIHPSSTTCSLIFLSVHIRICFSRRRELSPSHCPPFHHLRFDFPHHSHFTPCADSTRATSSSTHQDPQVSQDSRSFTRANHLLIRSLPGVTRKKPQRACCLATSVQLHQTCCTKFAFTRHALIAPALPG